ncbi:3243_t:CDS:1, partial [Dentiscutata heterogama]
MISINSNFSENKENYDPDNRIFSRAGSPGGNIWRRRRRTKVVQTPSRQTKRIKRVPLMEIFLNGSLDE